MSKIKSSFSSFKLYYVIIILNAEICFLVTRNNLVIEEFEFICNSSISSWNQTFGNSLTERNERLNKMAWQSYPVMEDLFLECPTLFPIPELLRWHCRDAFESSPLCCKCRGFEDLELKDFKFKFLIASKHTNL
jgi:hypothetical protein